VTTYLTCLLRLPDSNPRHDDGGHNNASLLPVISVAGQQPRKWALHHVAWPKDLEKARLLAVMSKDRLFNFIPLPVTCCSQDCDPYIKQDRTQRLVTCIFDRQSNGVAHIDILDLR
jgi:hypothetical protein